MQHSARASTDYSTSVYSVLDAGTFPDRPTTPSSFEHYLVSQGGRSSAADLSRTALQQGKKDRLTDEEEYKRAVYDASFLRAENAWFRGIRKAAVSLHEGTVQPVAETLASATAKIQDSLLRFYLAFGAVEHAIKADGPGAKSDTEATLRELNPVFEGCRAGLDEVQGALRALQGGSSTFSRRVLESNRSYASFFGVDYEEDGV
ncbi:hypothetical protein BDV59DRAFT_195850 [Aspergillus ambiguus]|uniref:uncharacterized protein n=1 Tax=Aspergillus ambiguus TaxID=176160 RepID=UPI003CCD6AEC